MLRALSLISASLPLGLAATTACPQGYGFVYPNATDPTDANLSYDRGQKINVQWRTPWQSVKLGFRGSDSDTFIFIDGISGGTTQTNYNWNVDVDNSNNDNSQYYLYIEDASDNSNNCYSAEWSIQDSSGSSASTTGQSSSASKPSTSKTTLQSTTQSASAVTTTGASGLTTVLVTPTASSISSLSIGAAGAGSSTATATATPTPTGLSSGAKAGIGIGVALGVLAIAGILFGCWYLRRKQKAISESGNHWESATKQGGTNMATEAKSFPTAGEAGGGVAGYYEPPKYAGPVPVPTHSPQELDSSMINEANMGEPARHRSLHELHA